jgi:hypothetical protein
VAFIVCFDIGETVRLSAILSGEYRILYNLRLILVPACKAVVLLIVISFLRRYTCVDRLLSVYHFSLPQKRAVCIEPPNHVEGMGQTVLLPYKQVVKGDSA